MHTALKVAAAAAALVLAPLIGNRAAEAGKETKPAAEKVGDSAKGFGHSIWEGMKSVGHSVKTFFTGK